MDPTNADPDHPFGDGDSTIAERVDARDLRCPMPLLKAKQALSRVHPGDLVQVLATDAGAARDFPAYTSLSGHLLLRYVRHDNGILEFIIKKREEIGS